MLVKTISTGLITLHFLMFLLKNIVNTRAQWHLNNYFYQDKILTLTHIYPD